MTEPPPNPAPDKPGYLLTLLFVVGFVVCMGCMQSFEPGRTMNDVPPLAFVFMGLGCIWMGGWATVAKRYRHEALVFRLLMRSAHIGPLRTPWAITAMGVFFSLAGVVICCVFTAIWLYT